MDRTLLQVVDLCLFTCFRYGRLLPSLQVRQFSAATGLSRMLIILGAMEPVLKGENLTEEVMQRQVRIHFTVSLKLGSCLLFSVKL